MGILLLATGILYTNSPDEVNEGYCGDFFTFIAVVSVAAVELLDCGKAASKPEWPTTAGRAANQGGCVPPYLTRRDGRVVYMNAAAERQVKAGGALRILNDRLFPTDPQARAAIAKAIDEVAANKIEVGPAVHSLAIPDTAGGGYVATLLPVERGRCRSIMAPFAASVAVFAQDPADVPLMPGEAFARLYGLTGGELRVLLALAQGLWARRK